MLLWKSRALLKTTSSFGSCLNKSKTYVFAVPLISTKQKTAILSLTEEESLFLNLSKITMIDTVLLVTINLNLSKISPTSIIGIVLLHTLDLAPDLSRLMLPLILPQILLHPHLTNNKKQFLMLMLPRTL